MAIVVESVSTPSYSNSGSVVVTKPSGTQTGDLMLIHFHSRNDGGGTPTGNIVTVPSTGWTLGQWNKGTQGVYQTSEFYYKIAEVGEGDSGWTFDGTVWHAESVYRISGVDTTTPVQTTNGGSSDNTSTPSISAGVTPLNANSLIMQFWGAQTISTAVSSYAIATDDITWTEAYDVNSASPGVNVSIAAAYGLRTATSATGSFSASGGTASTDWAGNIVVINPGPSTSIKTVDGLAYASVKTVNGLAIASVKTINGLA